MEVAVVDLGNPFHVALLAAAYPVKSFLIDRLIKYVFPRFHAWYWRLISVMVFTLFLYREDQHGVRARRKPGPSSF